MKSILLLLVGLCIILSAHTQTIRRMDVFVQEHSEQNISVNGSPQPAVNFEGQ